MGAGYEIGKTIEALIAYGHPPSAVWEYTPKQLRAWLEFAERRKQREMHDAIVVGALSSQAEGKVIKKQLKLLDQE